MRQICKEGWQVCGDVDYEELFEGRGAARWLTDCLLLLHRHLHIIYMYLLQCAIWNMCEKKLNYNQTLTFKVLV